MQIESTPLAYWRYLVNFLHGLLAWGVGSVAVGAAMLSQARTPFWRQFAWQQIGWGAVDAALALAGRPNATRQRAEAAAGTWEGDVEKEAHRLWLILAINGALDVLYVAGGAWLLQKRDPAQRGMGVGIMVQGAWLLLWDAVNAAVVGRRFLKNGE